MTTTSKFDLATANRMQDFCKWTGSIAPSALLDRDGAATDELLTFCRATGMSLDWLFLGDVRPMIWAAFHKARAKFATA